MLRLQYQTDRELQHAPKCEGKSRTGPCAPIFTWAFIYTHAYLLYGSPVASDFPQMCWGLGTLCGWLTLYPLWSFGLFMDPRQNLQKHKTDEKGETHSSAGRVAK